VDVLYYMNIDDVSGVVVLGRYAPVWPVCALVVEALILAIIFAVTRFKKRRILQMARHEDMFILAVQCVILALIQLCSDNFTSPHRTPPPPVERRHPPPTKCNCFCF